MVIVKCVLYIHIQIQSKKVVSVVVLVDNTLINKEFAKIVHNSPFPNQTREVVKQSAAHQIILYHQLVRVYIVRHIQESRMNMNAWQKVVKQTRYSKKMVNVKLAKNIPIGRKIHVCKINAMADSFFKKMVSVDTVTITLIQNHSRGEDALMIDILV